MSDDLPGISEEMGAGRALSRGEFVKRERERKAFRMWAFEGKSYTQIKNAMKLRSTDVARAIVHRGGERYEAEEIANLPSYRALLVGDMMELRGIVMEMARDRNLAAVDRAVKISERLSRIVGGDAQKDTADTGPTINVIVSPPWERGETIEGEAVDEPPGLPSGN